MDETDRGREVAFTCLWSLELSPQISWAWSGADATHHTQRKGERDVCEGANVSVITDRDGACWVFWGVVLHVMGFSDSLTIIFLHNYLTLLSRMITFLSMSTWPGLDIRIGSTQLNSTQLVLIELNKLSKSLVRSEV